MSPNAPVPQATIWGLAGATTVLVAVAAGAVAYETPALFWMAPLVLFAGLVVSVGWSRVPAGLHPFLPLGAALVLAGVALQRTDGIQLEEILFAAYYLPFLVGWYVLRIAVYREPLVWTARDWGVLAFLVAIHVHIGIGVLNGARPEDIQGDWLALSMMAFYFPVREVCARYPGGTRLMVAGFLFLALIALVRNLLATRETITTAAYAWEVARVRVTANEIAMTAGAVVCASLAADARRRSHLLMASVGFAALTVGVVLTQWRAYYVTLAIAVLLLVVMSDRSGRRRLFGLVLAGGALGAALLYLVLGDGLTLLALGVLDRLLSIGTATETDVSLINRFAETDAALAYILRNPVLGYGLGTTFGFFDMITDRTLVKPYAHNGYVSLWFKLGIIGVGSVLWLWGRTLWDGWALVRNRVTMQPIERTANRAAWSMLVALIPSFAVSAPFTTSDTTLCFVLLVAVVGGLADRGRLP